MWYVCDVLCFREYLKISGLLYGRKNNLLICLFPIIIVLLDIIMTWVEHFLSVF